MNSRKSQNSILVLTTLGVYLGLSFLASIAVFAQTSETNVTINKRPLKDFADSFQGKIRKNEIDPSAPFVFKIDGVLTDRGSLDTKKSKVVNTSGDPQMAQEAQEAFLAVADSGYFAYLADLNIKSFTLEISQDAENFSVHFVSDTAADERAKTLASALNALVSAQLVQAKTDDEKLLLQNVSASAAKSTFLLAMVLPKKAFQEFLLRKIQEAGVDKSNANG